MTIESLERVNYFDFQKATLQDLNVDQEFHLQTGAANFDAAAGSGVLLDFPEEPIIFDSDSLDSFQQGLVAITAFDGQGILETPYLSSDPVGGSQLAVSMTSARLDGVASTTIFLLGKAFDDSLMYEIVEIPNNMTEVTVNHFKEVTNILFQDFRGNLNTSVDGYGCLNVGGRCVIAEAGSMRLGRDPIVAEQIIEPNIPFRDFKTANAGKSLQVTLEEALGPSNDLDDLDINTSTASTRTFAEGGTTEVIYGQKFQMKSDNIQKITVLLSLASGSDWSGTLVVGLRRLQTSTTCSTDFLPDDDIGFDPETVSVEDIAVDQDDLAERGVVLDSTSRPVDFMFTGSNISNPSISGLLEDEYYVVTVRRVGSTSIGTILMEEARNSRTDTRMTVFQNNVWTDIPTSALWFRIWSDAAKVASGIMYDRGIRTAAPKTEVDNNGISVQTLISDIDLANTAEDAENYIVVQTAEEFTRTVPHPRVGDQQFSRKIDSPVFSALVQDEAFALINAGTEPVVLGRMRDRNSRSNPTISGTTEYPTLALGNTFTIINPDANLLTQNVVGSTLLANTTKTTLTYRIISQEVFTDLYGDLDGDGIVSIDDVARITELDGYSPSLDMGAVAAADQLQAVLNGATSVPELLRADVNLDGVVTSAIDGYFVNDFVVNGSALPAGSSFTRMELKVEPILDPQTYLNTDAVSTLSLESNDPDFILNTPFLDIDYRIDFIPIWTTDALEIVDLRRFVTTSFLDFNTEDLLSDPENGGLNSLFVPGDMFLTGSVKELDGTFHPLDFEKNIIELELPAGDTDGEINIFDNYVVARMMFSDGSLVAATAINNSQVKFETYISSYSKDLDGYDFDGYGANADENVGTFMDHDTGLLRIKARNIVNNPFFPEVRTRIGVSVSLKKAGFNYGLTAVDAIDFARVIT